jgi:polyisoprenoid-binding protein YceI
MKTAITCLLVLVAPAAALLAGSQTFDFKDPKGVNVAVFKLDAPLEAVSGSASGIAGTVAFDPANPGAVQGKITVASASLHVSNPVQQQHMQGDQWLEVAKFPEISFEAKALKDVKTTGDVTTAEVSGTFTLKGVAKDITAPVKFTYLKDKLGQRMPGKQGDLLVMRSTFTIKRSDFNIKPGQMEDKVSDAIEITLSIAGSAPK